MHIKDILKRLGLSEQEIAIYLYLVKAYKASIAQISAETGIYRPTIYRTLPSLTEKHLVSQVKVGKRTMYIAENPSTLQTLVDEVKEELEQSLPDLHRVYEGNQKRPIIRFVEGREAIKHIYDDMMRASKKGDHTYRYESPKDYKSIGKYYPKSYWNRATGADGEIEKFVITNEFTQKSRKPRLNRHSKAIPESYDTFDYNITQLIYKNTVAFIDFDSETATVIENKRFADFQKKIFKFLFGKL